MKFSIYLNRRVFVMLTQQSTQSMNEEGDARNIGMYRCAGLSGPSLVTGSHIIYRSKRVPSETKNT